VAQLTLLERVVKESLRVLPPVGYGQRISTAPFEFGQYSLPEKTILSYSQYVTNHLPDLYPLSGAFPPERWETDEVSPYQYLVSGADVHSCLGGTFALMEIKLQLAMLLQRFRLSLRDVARIDRHLRVTLSPKYGMPMMVSPQDRRFAEGDVRGDIHEVVDLRSA
jgi:cytochrome P450